MRKYAILKEGFVEEIKVMSDSEVSEISNMIVDIQDVIPEPQIGWFLLGNRLVPANIEQMSSDEYDSYQQTAQRKYGLILLPKLVDMVGARNLKLTRESTPVDVAALAGQMASVKLLLETGALKTVRGLCFSLKPIFPLHADILQHAVDEISNFLSVNDFE